MPEYRLVGPMSVGGVAGSCILLCMSRKAPQLIVCTGGGTAGHVLPLLPVIDQLKARGYEVLYIGSRDGPERELVGRQGIAFVAIPADKLRRYASWRTLAMPFNVLRGIWAAVRLLHRRRPDLVLSKGGFVAVPVVIAAAALRVPIVAHESDVSPGLTNRITRPLARKLCVTLSPEVTGRPLHAKEVVTGLPVRARFFCAEPRLAEAEFRLEPAVPLIVAFGGSSGSSAINQVVRAALSRLTGRFQMVHICGRGQVQTDLESGRYRQVESVAEGMPDLLARADVIVSRAGMTTLYEILTLRKSAVVIPLPLAASRGDQIENAALLQPLGLLGVLEQERLTAETLIAAIHEAFDAREARRAAIERMHFVDGTQGVVRVVEEVLSSR